MLSLPVRCALRVPLFLILVACCAASAFAQVSEGDDLRYTPVVRAVNSVRPAVVNIRGQKTVASSKAGEARRVNGMGTGVIIDPRGYIITNFHVVDGVAEIKVTLAGLETFVADIVSHDPKTDLAIIKIDAEDPQLRGEPLQVMAIGRSDDIMTGEPAIAIGNAYGYEHTVTEGIVSAQNRSVQVSEIQQYDDLIQTSADINPGNSGGPLLNINGEMIGINVAVRVGAQGIGFAIPTDRVMEVAAELMSIERLDHNWHGIVTSERGGDARGGLRVDSVRVGSPAEKIGLQTGDVLVSIGDEEIVRPLDLERALLGHDRGEAFEVALRRDSDAITKNIVLASLPTHDTVKHDEVWSVLGLRLRSIPKSQFETMGSRYRGGLRVIQVREDSPAGRQGIRRGDILVGMHIWETITAENVSYVLNRDDLADIEPVKFYILRDKQTLYGHLTVTGEALEQTARR